MAYKLPVTLLQINMQAVLLILMILFLRILLKNISKRYLHLLWMLVIVRLLCPFTLETSFSMVPAVGEVFWAEGSNPESDQPPRSDGLDGFGGEMGGSDFGWGTMGEGSAKDDSAERGTLREPSVFSGTLNSSIYNWLSAFRFSAVRHAGVAVLAAGNLVQYLRTKRKLRFAVHSEENIWECGEVPSAFVMGVFRPRIIIPFGLSDEQRRFMIKHEKVHIAHHDPLLCFLLTAALCIHWWNPVLWIAAGKMRQDVEMFCDEAVLRGSGAAGRKSYANILLQFAAARSVPAAGAGVKFGATAAEKRIRYILRKKETPRFVKIIMPVFIGFCAFEVMTADASAFHRDYTLGNSSGKEARLRPSEPAARPSEPAARPSESAVRPSESEASAAAKEEPHERSGSAAEEAAVIWSREEFAEAVRQGLKEDDAETLSDLVKYPMWIQMDGTRTKITTPEDLRENYDRIITDAVKQDVLETNSGTVTGTASGELFTNQYGTMLGNGAIWFSEFGAEGLKIYAVNVK